MTRSPSIRISKYFGGSSMQQSLMSLPEAKDQLKYFFTKDGGTNITVAVGGQVIKSYEELVAMATQEQYQDAACIDVGLFLSNDGTKSIWPK